MPGSMAFRAVLLPQAAILVFVWWIIEWVSVVLMQVWFVLLFLAWRRSELSVIVRTDSTIDRH